MPHTAATSLSVVAAALLPIATGAAVVIGCVDRCGQHTPADGNCSCDAACLSYADCCSDYSTVCADMMVTGLCEGLCDAKISHFSGCWCDNLCATYGDCCEDYTQLCELPSGTCHGFCGEAGSNSAADCWCDSECATFGDCCEDYTQLCETPSPPPPTPVHYHVAPDGDVSRYVMPFQKGFSFEGAKALCETYGMTLPIITSEEENLKVLFNIWHQSKVPGSLKVGFWLGLTYGNEGCETGQVGHACSDLPSLMAKQGWEWGATPGNSKAPFEYDNCCTDGYDFAYYEDIPAVGRGHEVLKEWIDANVDGKELNNCMAMMGDGKWDAVKCSSGRYVICEGPPPENA